MRRPPETPSAQLGFSLVELLVVIAVIAIIAAIAIPNIANITQSAANSSAKRNAQNIVATWNAARAAGMTETGNTEFHAAEVLTNGVTVTNGGQVMTFRIDGLTFEAIYAATRFYLLHPSGTRLEYYPGQN